MFLFRAKCQEKSVIRCFSQIKTVALSKIVFKFKVEIPILMMLCFNLAPNPFMNVTFLTSVDRRMHHGLSDHAITKLLAGSANKLTVSELPFVAKPLFLFKSKFNFHFHLEGFAPGLALKQRRKATRKLPIRPLHVRGNASHVGDRTIRYFLHENRSQVPEEKISFVLSSRLAAFP